LPSDRPRPAVLSRRAGRVRRSISSDLADRIRRVAGEHHLTPFVVIETALAILCARLTRSEDIIIGTVSEGRRHPAVERTVGCFVNPIALRHEVRSEQSALDAMRNASAIVLDAMAHDDLPFTDVLAALNPTRTPSFEPIFQVLCQLRISSIFGEQDWGDLTVAPLDLSPVKRDAELAFVFDHHPAGIEATVEYASDLFDGSTVERFLDLHLALIERMAEGPDKPIDEIFSDAVSWLLANASGRVDKGAIRGLTERSVDQVGSRYAPSPNQRMLWLEVQAAPSGTSFYSVEMFAPPPTVDRSRLAIAFERVIASFQALRLDVDPQGFLRDGRARPPGVAHVAVESLGSDQSRI
ncbi:MAG: hypothetical protein GY788_20340, partial [bacterium]|nr:hypothetical protein [bacterium]